METGDKKIKYLVADTTAFINNVSLNDYAETILTVPDVVNEVKNKRQLRRLVVLPYDLKVQEPKSEILAHVTNFAKKTGDYKSLSAIDMKVIALTYELHVENDGSADLRSEPIVPKIVVSKEKPDELVDNTKLIGFYDPKSKSKLQSESDKSVDNTKYSEEEDFSENEIEQCIESKTDDSTNDNNNKLNDGNENIEHKVTEVNLKKITDDVQNCQSTNRTENDLENYDKSDEELFAHEDYEGHGSSEEEDDIDIVEALEKINIDEKIEEILPYEKKPEDKDSDSDHTESEQDEGDDEAEWITPSNFKKKVKQIEGSLLDIVPTVACMTTDYALQNVLMQINLHVCALDGRMIKQLRTYILRCYACFKTTSVMTKIFCPNCGNKTLKRVAVSLDENGKQVIHINTKRPLTAKFKNQSLPRPKGGKHSRNPLIVEDQPMPKQMPSRVAKTKTNPLNEDYIAGYSPFATRDLNSKSALLRSKGHLKEWARNNAFEEERRKKYFNRLVK